MRHSFDLKCQYTLRWNVKGCTGNFLGEAKSAREQSHWISSNRNLTPECAIEVIKRPSIESERDIKSRRIYILIPLKV